MVCLGFEPGAAGWKAQTTPLSYGRNCNGSNAFIQRLLGVYAMKTFQSTKTTLLSNKSSAWLKLWVHCFVGPMP